MVSKYLYSWILTIIIFLPLAGGVAALFFPKGKDTLVRHFGLAVSLVTFLVSLFIFKWFKINAEFQMRQAYEWIPGYGINYHVAVDGISLFLVLLTTLLTFIVILASYSGVKEKVKQYVFFMLMLETGMLGTFLALNLFLFYVFWEVMLIPMYFLIGVWGGERRIYAAVKFFIYTMVGSLLMLVAIISLVWMHMEQTGEITFEYLPLLGTRLAAVPQLLMFGAFALAFAIKVPMFPFHTWLPDAHVEAPTGGSVILAGVLLKMGTYGFLRFAIPFFPDAVMKMVPVMMVLATIGIIYGALVSMVQPDLKKLVAYSSVSHLGFVMLGMFALTTIGVQGSVLQMVNHGLSTGALFLLVGVIYERRHTRLIADFGGLSKVMPVFGTMFMIIMLSSVGLPGLNGFVGEFLILMGTFTSRVHPAMKAFAVVSALGVIFAAVYLLWMFQRVMFGPVKHEENKNLKDLSLRETVMFLLILVFVFWIGIYPKTFTKRIEPAVNKVVRQVVPEHARSARVLSPAGDEEVRHEEIKR